MPPSMPPTWRGARGVGISQVALVACAAFGPRLPAGVVASAIASGLQQGGLLEADVLALPAGEGQHEDVREPLDELDFDARMRRARAVVVGTPLLEERALVGSVVFEIATRARQGGIPVYAVTAERAVDAFDARILDLQVILQARSRGGLVSAGRKLAGSV
jgi:glycerate 2-kinase